MTKSYLDITGQIGPLYPSNPPEWPMYAFNTPAYDVWNAIANVLFERGWTVLEIKGWLQSKSARWAMDGSLGEALVEAARNYAATIPDSGKL
jgi:hypothetical protein